MDFPIEIKTWKDWFAFRKRMNDICRFDLNGIRNYGLWLWNDPVKYIWVEKPGKRKKGSPPDFESQLVPFAITWIDFRFQAVQDGTRYIYGVLRIADEELDAKD